MNRANGWALAVVLLQGVGCTAQVAGDPASNGSGAAATASTPDGQAVTPPSVDACGSGDPGFVGMRRLTRSELNHTFEELLGETAQPADALPNEDSLLASQANVSALGFEKLEAVVSAAVEAAWRREATVHPQNKLRVCDPLVEGGACAEKIVMSFARRALRRPLSAADRDSFLRLVQVALDRGDGLDVGAQLAVKAALLDAELVFRVELDADRAPVRALTQHELAARLAFWLWGGPPDGELEALTDAGKLGTLTAVEQEAARMLADPRATRFADGLGAYWLGLTSLDVVQPNPSVFPEFDEDLRRSMAEESRAFVRDLLARNQPLSVLAAADYTFVNARLRSHYGLPSAGAASATELERIMLPPGARRGILGHGSVLTMTSAATRTSPVKRGKWLFSKLLCGAMPPPPPMVDMLSDAAQAAETERERLAIHRTNPSCAGCHNILDPLGLGLENFDGVGRYRENYPNGRPIDASGALPSGPSFTTLPGLQAGLAEDPRVAACAERRVFSYAIGREPSCVSAAPTTVGSNGLQDVVVNVLHQPAFAYRRGETEGDLP